MPNLCDIPLCTGCAACANACQQNYISMHPDRHGFTYPTVNTDLCVECGKCQKSCPVLQRVSLTDTTSAYAAVNLNESERHNSTSGGAFTLLAKWILSRRGIVFGATYNDDFSVSHTWVDSEESLIKLNGSKYAQSDIGTSYRKVKELLEEGREVLFSGTPCQVAGLKSYLVKPYNNLLCVDLICHGVSSPAVWQHYIDYRSAKDNCGKRPCKINMRSKTTGWQRYSVEFQYETSIYSSFFADDPYMYGYIHDLYTRSSCFDCHFKGINRNSDFTLGDYWGIEGQHPEMNDGQGTSLVFLHSEKSRRIWMDISDGMKMKEVSPTAAVQWNPMAVKSTLAQSKQEEFLTRYENEDFSVFVWQTVPKNTEPKPSLLRIWFAKLKRLIIRHV